MQKLFEITIPGAELLKLRYKILSTGSLLSILAENNPMPLFYLAAAVLENLLSFSLIKLEEYLEQPSGHTF